MLDPEELVAYGQNAARVSADVRGLIEDTEGVFSDFKVEVRSSKHVSMRLVTVEGTVFAELSDEDVCEIPVGLVLKPDYPKSPPYCRIIVPPDCMLHFPEGIETFYNASGVILAARVPILSRWASLPEEEKTLVEVFLSIASACSGYNPLILKEDGPTCEVTDIRQHEPLVESFTPSPKPLEQMQAIPEASLASQPSGLCEAVSAPLNELDEPEQHLLSDQVPAAEPTPSHEERFDEFPATGRQPPQEPFVLPTQQDLEEWQPNEVGADLCDQDPHETEALFDGREDDDLHLLAGLVIPHSPIGHESTTADLGIAESRVCAPGSVGEVEEAIGQEPQEPALSEMEQRQREIEDLRKKLAARQRARQQAQQHASLDPPPGTDACSNAEPQESKQQEPETGVPQTADNEPSARASAKEGSVLPEVPPMQPNEYDAMHPTFSSISHRIVETPQESPNVGSLNSCQPSPAVQDLSSPPVTKGIVVGTAVPPEGPSPTFQPLEVNREWSSRLVLEEKVADTEETFESIFSSEESEDFNSANPERQQLIELIGERLSRDLAVFKHCEEAKVKRAAAKKEAWALSQENVHQLLVVLKEKKENLEEAVPAVDESVKATAEAEAKARAFVEAPGDTLLDLLQPETPVQQQALDAVTLDKALEDCFYALEDGLRKGVLDAGQFHRTCLEVGRRQFEARAMQNKLATLGNSILLAAGSAPKAPAKVFSPPEAVPPQSGAFSALATSGQNVVPGPPGGHLSPSRVRERGRSSGSTSPSTRQREEDDINSLLVEYPDIDVSIIKDVYYNLGRSLDLSQSHLADLC